MAVVFQYGKLPVIVKMHYILVFFLSFLDSECIKPFIRKILTPSDTIYPNTYLNGPCIVFSGRWWIVGSAWSERETKNASVTLDVPEVIDNGNILELARQQRMNTEIRRNIFCIVITSEVSFCNNLMSLT